MRIDHCFIAVSLALLLFSGCAGVRTAPTPEERQALAPGGKLRVGLYLGNPISAVRDPASGELKGLGIDLGKEFAQRLGVTFEAVVHPSIAALLKATKSGQWDVSFIGDSPERANVMDFTAPLLEVEFGYLVPNGSSISTLADVDQPGVRIAVQEKGVVDVAASRTLKRATLIRVANLSAGLELLRSGKADVLTAVKPSLFENSHRLPGSRILDGRFGSTPLAMAVPKGRDLCQGTVRRARYALPGIGVRRGILAGPGTEIPVPCRRDEQEGVDPAPRFVAGPGSIRCRWQLRRSVQPST